MGRDLTHAIRLRDLRADYERAGVEFDADKLDIPVADNDASDFTRAEIERLRNDSDREAYETKLQAETLAQTEGR